MRDSAVANFINDFSLERTDGLIVFNATVFFYDHENTLYSISSEIQIVRILDMPVLYIMDFLQDIYAMPEMYSPADYHFSYQKAIGLEIRNIKQEERFIVSINPPNTQI